MERIKCNFSLVGFRGYKDNSLRIIYRNKKSKRLISMPLDKADRIKYNSNMSKTEQIRLFNKYIPNEIIKNTK